MTLKTTLIGLAIMAGMITACQHKPVDTAQEKISTPSDDSLSIQVAKEYVANYAKRAGTVISDGKEVPDTRAVWFDIERLKSLIKKIETEGGDGIRFYFATYDSSYNAKSNTHVPIKEYWNHNTLIMVSTKDSLGYHRDYYNDKINSKAANGMILSTTPENRGEMCPPPANCQDIGATLISDTIPAKK